MDGRVDSVMLNFSIEGLILLNIAVGMLMFGVAMELRLSDFARVAKEPTSTLVGFLAQFILLPALTFALVWLIEPQGSIALGMILVAACPGGNISNYLSHLARANTALSVSLTAIATLTAIFATPLNFELWAGFYPPAAALLQEIQLNIVDAFLTIGVLLGIPLAGGMYLAHRYPVFTHRIARSVRIGSMVLFLGFVIVALANNWSFLKEWVGFLLALVVGHNAMALGTGWAMGVITRRSPRDTRSIAIETGIQNSGLALVIIFTFFDGLGGMALVAAGWGIWHMISGLMLALILSRIPVKKASEVVPGIVSP